ncbi:MAG TPA: cupredoxin domain-containing protein [Conexibacter sp.]|nr:cupredoxin domain-containing protein [Conexibacter sp.]
MPSLPSPGRVAAVAAVLLACAGCGEPDPIAVDATPLRLTLSEYRIAPQAVSVPAGRVELVVRNGGATVHRLEVRSGDRRRRLAATPPLRPGEQARLVLELGYGTYVTTCARERHHTLGEHGAIVAR